MVGVGAVRRLELGRKERTFFQEDAEAKLVQVADLIARLQRINV